MNKDQNILKYSKDNSNSKVNQGDGRKGVQGGQGGQGGQRTREKIRTIKRMGGERQGGLGLLFLITL